MSTPHLRAIRGKAAASKREPVATTEQIAAMKFPTIMALARMPKADLEAKVQELAQHVYGCAALCAEIVRLDKPSLVRKVADNHDLFGSMLMKLAYATDDSKVLTAFIRAAEIRLAVALAVVEGDDGVLS